MEAKLRRKFIFVSMSSLMTVLILLVAGINIFHYSVQVRSQETLLDLIIENAGIPPVPPPKKPDRPFQEFKPLSPETGFTTRYFIVRSDQAGTIHAADMDFIASVSEEQAEEYVQKILQKGKSSGFYGDYRFRTYRDGDETVFVFLNSSNELQSIKLLAATSIIIVLIVSAAVFVLLCLTSKVAIRPFIKNVERQKQFITNAGHELKTPLTSIATSADVLALTQGENEWLVNIRKQTLRLTKLVGELVALSRLDEEDLIQEQAPFSLSDAIWETVEPFLGLAQAAGKSFEQDIEDGLSYCGNQSDIQKMLSILLDNAIKYSDAGGSIRLNVRKLKRNIVIKLY
ncbi:MAG: HAMP domain-containing histidine kinase, partial [Fastidiosipila sp.]|nr:HAMP domain-containing histidine kinase [Fastidiosipila sp.]